MHDSHTIFRKTADDKRQITVHLLNKGATIAGISLSGFGANPQSDVVLSYSSADEFDSDPYYLGATVGPVANRLKDGCFDLPNGTHAVEINEPDPIECTAWRNERASSTNFSGVTYSC